jgi:Ca2+-binding RTX toxin-like protein
MPWETEYCSAHLGNVVPATDKNLLVFSWYMGGITVLDFANPASPSRVAYYDGAGPTGPAGDDSFDNWAAYWYEGPALPGNNLTIYATDGVHDPSDNDGGARGFLSLRADVAANELNLDHLNPQTQDLGVVSPQGLLSCKGKVATLVGTNGNDVLVGTPGEDVVVGLGGKDIIKTGNGNDTICAGSGSDRVRAGNSAKGGFDLVLGEGGKDKLFGQGGRDRLRGGGGKDLIKAGSGRDRLAGQKGNDALRGQGGADKLNGGPGRDLCNGGAGRDTATRCERVQLVP